MKRPSSTTIFVLKALIPYTKSNLMLASTPSAFFNELERLSKHKRSTIRSAYYRSIKSGYIEKGQDGKPYITNLGRRLIHAHEPEKLEEGYNLIVAFDVPEKFRAKRNYLRLLLMELKFEQIQRSVWVSQYSHADFLKTECKELGVEKFVKIFEAKEVN